MCCMFPASHKLSILVGLHKKGNARGICMPNCRTYECAVNDCGASDHFWWCILPLQLLGHTLAPLYLIGHPYASCNATTQSYAICDATICNATDMPCFECCFGDKDSQIGLPEWHMLKLALPFLLRLVHAYHLPGSSACR